MAWTGGASWPISVYLIALALITFFATIAAPETAGETVEVVRFGRIALVMLAPDFRVS
jgi:hypothetical protein